MYTRKTTTAGLWLRPGGDLSRPPRRRLICLPHAGGTAGTYGNWPGMLPPDLAVYTAQYPGRQDRYGEPAAPSIEEMAESIASAATSFIDDPLVVFGHSMGAYVAYEVVAELERRHGPVVDLLVVSGVIAPHHKETSELHKLGDSEFVAEVARDNESFAELLVNPDLIEVLLPMIRDDYRLFEMYRPSDPPALSARLVATGGTTDRDVDRDGLALWGDLAAGEFEALTFPGGHFYLVEDEPALVGALAERLPAV